MKKFLLVLPATFWFLLAFEYWFREDMLTFRLTMLMASIWFLWYEIKKG